MKKQLMMAMPGKFTPCAHYTCIICTNSGQHDPHRTTPGHMGMNISPLNNLDIRPTYSVVGPLLFGSLNVVTKANMIRFLRTKG